MGARRASSTQRKGNKMSLKLKVLGLGLLAVMATSAFAAMNASATQSGHFVSDSDYVTLTGTEQFDPNDLVGKPHHLSFFRLNSAGTATESGEPIKCTHVAYHGETLEGAAATTTQVVRVRPDYTGSQNCSTGGVGPHNITVDVPAGCETNVFEFKSGNTGTVSVNCNITITHPNCETTIPNIAENHSLHGITYDTIIDGGKHALTVTANVKKIRGQFHGGICVFLGTSQTFEMVGSATVWGEDALGNRVNITHTDP